MDTSLTREEMNAINVLENKKICACCGKEFYVTSPYQWAYKKTVDNSLKYYHTWSCFRTAEEDKKKSTEKKIREASLRAATKKMQLTEECELKMATLSKYKVSREFEDRIKIEKLLKQVKNVPNHQVLYMYFIDCMPLRKISESTGKAQSTVRTYLYRGLREITEY